MNENVEIIFEWLLEKVGIFCLFINILVIFGIVAAVGLVTPTTALGLACLTLLFLLAVLSIGLYAKLRAKRREYEEAANVVSRYVKKYSSFDVVDWVEEVIIGAHGDTVIRRWLSIKALQDDFWFCWSAADQQHEQSLSDRRKRKVRARAREFRPAAGGDRDLGAPYKVTSAWEGNMHRIFVHFDPPPRNGDVRHILFEWKWPRLYAHLLDGGEETQDWNITRKCLHMRAEIRFESACRIIGMSNVSPFDNCPLPDQLRDGKRLKIISDYRNLDPDNEVPGIGVREELTGGRMAIKFGYRFGVTRGRILI